MRYRRHVDTTIWWCYCFYIALFSDSVSWKKMMPLCLNFWKVKSSQ